MISFEDHNPETLEEAIALLTENLTPDEVTYIKEHTAASTHFSIGMAMRNAWLWDTPSERRPLAQHMRDRFELAHADDMSGLILRGVDCFVSGKQFDPYAVAFKYQKYWLKEGVGPLAEWQAIE